MDPGLEHRIDLLNQALRDKYLVAEFLMSNVTNAEKVKVISEAINHRFTELYEALDEISTEALESRLDLPSMEDLVREKNEFDARIEEWLDNTSAHFDENSGGAHMLMETQPKGELSNLYDRTDEVSISSSQTSRATIKRQMRAKVNRELAQVSLRQTADRLKEEEELAKLTRQREQLTRQRELREAQRKVELADAEVDAWDRISEPGIGSVGQTATKTDIRDLVRRPSSFTDGITYRRKPMLVSSASIMLRPSPGSAAVNRSDSSEAGEDSFSFASATSSPGRQLYPVPTAATTPPSTIRHDSAGIGDDSGHRSVTPALRNKPPLLPRRQGVSFTESTRNQSSASAPLRSISIRQPSATGHRLHTPGFDQSALDATSPRQAVMQSTPATQPQIVHHHYHGGGSDHRFLPHPEISKFQGKPRKYHPFIKSFDQHIASKVSTDDMRLVYLLPHCADHVRKKLEHFSKKANGYQLARTKLYEDYGQPHIIADACEVALKSFPSVRQNKPAELSAYADLLDECLTTLEDIGEFASVNTLETIMSLVSKLPQKIREAWPKYALKVRATIGSIAKFPDFAEFVKRKSDESNSLYGKRLNEMNLRNTPPPHPLRRSKASMNKIDAASNKSQPEERTNANCPYCKGSHQLARCEKFGKLDYENIVQFLRDARLCFKCLSLDHIAAKCEETVGCSVKGCKGKRHHTLLHRNFVPKSESSQNAAPGETKRVTCTLSRPSDSVDDPQDVFLCVVPVKVVHGSKEVETYAFVDPGSTASLCSEKLINLLGLSRPKRQITLRTVGSRPVQYNGISLDKITVMPLYGERKLQMRDVLSVEKVPATPNVLPDKETLRKLRHLRGIDFPRIDGGTVNLLIGADMPEVSCFQKSRKGRKGGPWAVKTALGWSLFGPGRSKTSLEVTSDKKPISCSIQVNHLTADKELLQREIDCLWKTDFGDGTSVFDVPTSREDRLAFEMMQKSVKYVDGHFQLPLLWKPGMRDALRNNLSMASNRTRPLKKRMLRDEDYRARYTGSVEKYILDGHACEVLAGEIAAGNPIWYLPHFSVFHPRKPDKLRVVFDAAAKYFLLCLNDCLMQGPDLVCSLIGVLLRFRKGRIPLVADIEAMFHQIRVAPEDQSALHFLWWRNGDLSRPPVPHRMLVHLFGSKSSPACATFCLKHTASVFGSEFDPHVCEIVQKSFYVDDCLATAETAQEAIDTVDQITRLLAKGGFHLTKWLTNDDTVLSTIPQSERAKKVQNHAIDDSMAERVLGVHWSVAADQFGFSVSVPEKPLTRRGVLSAVASLFDPLGIVSPAILPAKLLLQSLCRKNLDWDEPMDEEDVAAWREWVLRLPNLENVKIDRCFRPPDFGAVSSVQLHHFADASTVAYSAVSYLRIIDENSKIHCTFLFGKSRLAPMKSISIPRLELTAAVLAVKLDGMFRKELDFEDCSSTFWSDSMAIIHSIRNSTKRFPTFFANRLAQIDRGSDPLQRRYVPSKLNPADIGSRGVDASSMASSRWLSGPEFLLEPESRWPEDPTTSSLPEDLVSSESASCDTSVNAIEKQSVKRETPQSSAKSRNHVISDLDTTSVMNKFVESFSTLHRLKKAASWMVRFKQYLQSRVRNKLQMGLGQSCRNFSGF